MADSPAAKALSAMGTLLGIALFLSPTPMMRAMWRERDAAKYQASPSIMMLLNCVLWSGYGIFEKHSAEIAVVNVIGAGIALTYLALFYKLTRQAAGRAKLARLVGGIGAASVVLFGALYAVPAAAAFEQRGMVVALIAIVFNVGLLASPLQAIYLALKDMDTSRVPALMSAVSLLSSVCWASYGILIGDYFICAPNAIGVGLSLLQLVVLARIRLARRGPQGSRAAGGSSPHVALEGGRFVASKVSGGGGGGDGGGGGGSGGDSGDSGDAAAVLHGGAGGTDGARHVEGAALTAHDALHTDDRWLAVGVTTTLDVAPAAVGMPPPPPPTTTTTQQQGAMGGAPPAGGVDVVATRLRVRASSHRSAAAADDADGGGGGGGGDTPLDRIARTLSGVRGSELAVASPRVVAPAADGSSGPAGAGGALPPRPRGTPAASVPPSPTLQPASGAATVPARPAGAGAGTSAAAANLPAK